MKAFFYPLIRGQKQNLRGRLAICLMIAGISLCSCNDFLEVSPNHVASESRQWNKLEDVRASLMGIYGLTRAAVAENCTHWICGDLRLGDFSVHNRSDLLAAVNNEMAKTYPSLTGISNWRRFYAAINAAAVFIENAPQVVGNDKAYSDANLRMDIAQAKAVRAFLYFYMARLWGDVPLITESYDNGSFPLMERTDKTTVINYARGELLEAIAGLPYLYGSSSNLYYGNSESYWRGMLFNKLSAYAILAHIAAWEGNYADTETHCAFILDNITRLGGSSTPLAIASLVSPEGLFGDPVRSPAEIDGRRIIGLTASFSDKEATQTGHIEELTLANPLVQKAYPDIYLTKEKLFAIFGDLADLRFGFDTIDYKYSTNYIYDMNADYPMFGKIKVVQNGIAADGDYAVFGSTLVFTRMEEIALLRAEALTALNRGQEAIAFLNLIRTSRGLRSLSLRNDFDYDNDLLMNAVFDERRKELMGEGWYWFDRIRKQKLLRDDPQFADLINNGGVYLPVAKDVIDRNPLIKQNEYWK
jgi:hypothetical protein